MAWRPSRLRGALAAALLTVAAVLFGSAYRTYHDTDSRLFLQWSTAAELTACALGTPLLIAAVAVRVTADGHGLVRRAAPGRRKSWAWHDYVGVEVRKTVLGQAIFLIPGSGSKPVRPGPPLATPAAVDSLAAAAGAHLPVTRPARRRHPGPAITTGCALAALALASVVLPWRHLVREGPGVALRVDRRVSATGLPLHRWPGEILSLSVNLKPPTLLDAVLDGGDPAVTELPPSAVYGHETAAAYDHESAQDNTLARSTAIYAALAHLGYPVTVTGGQPVVSWAPPGSPLHPGDHVAAIGGTPTPYIENLYAALDGRRVGDEVDATVLDGHGVVSQRRITLGQNANLATLTTLAGAEFTSRPLRLGPLPFRISLDTGGEGGPSAGLALTLGLLSDLQPSPLAGPLRVAVTGTLSPAGLVGPVGGLRQKVALAERAGATLLLVPHDEQAVATSFASPGLRVVGVATLDQALLALARS